MTAEPEEDRADELEQHSWEVSPSSALAKKRPIVIVVALLAGVFGFFFLNLFAGLVGVCAVLASAIEIFLPRRFTLNEKEASAKIGLSTSAIRWSEVERIVETEAGYRLSPLKKESRLDAFRGVHLFGGGTKEELLGKIDRFRKSDGRGLAGEAERRRGDRTD